MVRRARRCVTALAAVVLFGSFVSSAAASEITINSTFQGRVVGYDIQGLRAPGVIGAIDVSGSTGLGLPASQGFDAYCVDLFSDIFLPGTPTSPSSLPATILFDPAPMSAWSDPTGHTLNGPDAGSRVAYLYTQFAASARGNDLARTALAAAIWNTLYDTDASVSDGQGTFFLYCDSTTIGFNGCDGTIHYSPAASIVVLANSYLGALSAATPEAIAGSQATWLRLSDASGDVQDLIGPAGAATPVPEPASYMLLGTGAAALLARRRAIRARV